MEKLDPTEAILRDLEEKSSVKVGEVNVLFLDVSSTCTGYAIASLDFATKTAKVTKAGALWLNPKWDEQTKYGYIGNAILTYFEIIEQVDYIIHEAYSVNKDRLQGVNVVPEMVGAIKFAANENGVKVKSFPPQSWRSEMRVKKVPVLDAAGVPKKNYKGGFVYDWKQPAADRVKEIMDVPDTIISNITGKERATPNDLTDALGLCLGWLKRSRFKILTKGCQFNTHIGAMAGAEE